MGFFDKVRDVLTSSDAERDRAARRQDAPQQATAAPVTEGAAASAPATEPPAPAPPASPAAEPATGSPTAQPEGGTSARHRTHTVRRGDSLASIAAEHGVDAEEMARLNGIDNPDLIYPGQVFRVPTR